MPTSASKCSLVLLVLGVLLDCSRAGDCPWAHGEAHSLHYDLNITYNKQPGCMARGQVDEKNYLLYDCVSDKVIAANLLRGGKGLSVWTEQTSMLRDVGDLIKQQLPGMTPEKYADRAPLTLQVRMMCQCKANGHTSGSWEFGFDGQRFLVFDSESGKYTVVHSGGEQMKEKWENDKEVTKFFTYISMGDCNKWLEVLVHWNKELATAAAPTTATVTATATATAQSKAQSKAPAITFILPVILTCWTILGSGVQSKG